MNRDKLFKYLALICYIAIICLFIYNSYTLYLKGALTADFAFMRFIGLGLSTVLFFIAQRVITREFLGKPTRV